MSEQGAYHAYVNLHFGLFFNKLIFKHVYTGKIDMVSLLNFDLNGVTYPTEKYDMISQ